MSSHRPRRSNRKQFLSTTWAQRRAAVAAAVACCAVTATSHATSVNFGGRTWTTHDSDPFNAPSYSASGYTGSMTGNWAADATITTPVTLNVGDVISYDSALLSTGGWFSDTGFGFIDNTGLYDSAHSNYRGGKVQREWNSFYQFYAYDPSSTQQANWFLPNNFGDNIHYEWTFDTATHVQVAMTVPNEPTETIGWNITNIADVKAFKAWLWDSQGVLNVSNFKQRPTAPAPSGNQFVWNAGAGNYVTGANWVGGNAPTLADNAVINNGGTVTVNTSGANSARAVNLDVSNGTLNVQSGGELLATTIMRIGHGTSTGTVNQTGGLVGIDINGGADLRIGFDAGATGNYNLDGGELWVADSLSVGQNGTGVMTMTGGWISHSGFFTVGNNPGAHGTFTMTGGVVDMSFGDFEVGDETVGIVNISGGTFNTPKQNWFSIGNRPLGNGTATISGTAVVNTNSMIVGRNATITSTLNVNGGTINTNIYNDPINGPNGGSFWVGLDAPGQATVTGGTINVQNDVYVGGEVAAGVGQLSFTGGTMNVADDFIVGYKANGTATIGGTAQISSVGWIVLGDDAGINGTLNVNGGTINQSFGDLEVGDAGNGTYNQTNGAVNIWGNVYVANQAGSTGDANVSGGTLTAQNVVNNGNFDASGNSVTTLGTNALGNNPGNGFIDGTGAMTVAGTAVVNAAHIRQGSLTMTGGTVTIASNGGAAGASKVGSLSMSGSSKIDLKDNDLVAASTPVSAVRSLIISGYAGGTWTGNGIVTSGTPPLGASAGLGYAQGNDPAIALTDLSGQSFGASDSLVKYTYLGDGDLDGDVDGVDVGLWSGNFTGAGGSTTKLWTEGDWDYDGDVDGVDVGMWSGNFTGSGGGVLSQPATGAAAVPEPNSLLVLSLAAMPLIRRRRCS
jgi:hypothetical protein